MYAQIVLPLALKNLTYKIPDELCGKIQAGSPVFVQLRKKKMSGYVVDLNEDEPDFDISNIKAVEMIDESMPTLSPKFLKLLNWISSYYQYPLGEVIRAVFPKSSKSRMEKFYKLNSSAQLLTPDDLEEFKKRGGKRFKLYSLLLEGPQSPKEIASELKSALSAFKKAGLVDEIKEKRVPRFINAENFPTDTKIHSLNEQQANAYSEIRKACDSQKFSSFLLEGVTGSGKTEVYLHSAQYCLQQNKTVMILVPEISLTPQLLTRVQSRLGNQIAVLHSGLSDLQRSDQINLILGGQAKVVVGARSTVLAPIENLGMIIIDEEHESAFKQEDRLRYNARDLAMVRAKSDNAVVILGSATPSLESYFQTLNGKSKRLSIQNRVANKLMPDVELVNLCKEKLEHSLSNRAKLLIKQTMAAGRQSILFLNRRGYSSSLICGDCGTKIECPNCSVSLTLYKGGQQLVCHYCGFNKHNQSSCSDCGSSELESKSLGTEALEEEVRECFPDARVIRIDRESVSQKNELERRLRLIADAEVDIVIGTQMIAKGHDFPGIDLSIIVNADQSLNIPDFRAAERSFQLFTQVAGRAGRGQNQGKVLIQCYDPDHFSIQAAKKQNFLAFAQTELETRMQFNYPPYARIIRIVIQDRQDSVAKNVCSKICGDIAQLNHDQIKLLGPAPAVLHKIQNSYRWNVLLKSESASELNRLIKTFLPDWKRTFPRIKIIVDVDPLSLL